MDPTREEQARNTRGFLIEDLRGLSDLEFQQKAWVQGIAPEGYDPNNFASSFGDTVNDIFGCFHPSPRIDGYGFLKDDKEVQAVTRVLDAINSLFQRYGNKRDDRFYFDKPEYARVVAAASDACKVLTANE